MAKQDFLDNLRVARNLLFHARAETGSPHLDPQALERTSAQAAIWLTPKSVQGFNAEDFPELGPDRQRELQAAVREFLEVANQVPPKAPATPEQLRIATAAFATILKILQPYLPTPQEGEKVEEALKSIEFPPWVVNWDYELDTDQYDEPAVWVNLFIEEGSAPRAEFVRLAPEMTRKLLQALTAAGSDRWPYIRVRTAVEHKTV
ncbi:MAG: hypothetical protein L0Z62_32505 [Gemmataceae bacterium]|nr:hypothetical protein [Gemmataceae bacterium]